MFGILAILMMADVTRLGLFRQPAIFIVVVSLGLAGLALALAAISDNWPRSHMQRWCRRIARRGEKAGHPTISGV